MSLSLYKAVFCFISMTSLIGRTIQFYNNNTTLCVVDVTCYAGKYVCYFGHVYAPLYLYIHHWGIRPYITE